MLYVPLMLHFLPQRHNAYSYLCINVFYQSMNKSMKRFITIFIQCACVMTLTNGSRL